MSGNQLNQKLKSMVEAQLFTYCLMKMMHYMLFESVHYAMNLSPMWIFSIDTSINYISALEMLQT